MPESKTATVVGAGMVGLATAWHLQERGVEVTVLDRRGVASGASWGNAGWLTPGMAMPLADPALWSYGPKAMLDPDPDAALSVPFRFDRALWSFLVRFMSHATPGEWQRAMAALTPIDRLALEAYDELEAGGVHATSYPSRWVVGFERERESRPFVHELRGVAKAGQEIRLSRVPDGVRVPHLSPAVQSTWTLEGQRYIEPGPYTQALATSVSARGAKVLTDSRVEDIRPVPGGVEIAVHGHGRMTSDSVVIATGAWLPGLAQQFGVRTKVQAGRGYSFSVPVEGPPIDHPVYFPARRVACTPYQGRLRIAGTMEFRGPDEPFQEGRVRAMVNSVRGLFEGVDLDSREDEWVGSRPVTPDGLPLVGRTAAPGIYVAGGHGMWGIVLGPATGRALAELITTGQTPEEIRPFDPLR